MATLSSTSRIYTDIEVGVTPELTGDRSTSSHAPPPRCPRATKSSAGESAVCAYAESVAWSSLDWWGGFRPRVLGSRLWKPEIGFDGEASSIFLAGLLVWDILDGPGEGENHNRIASISADRCHLLLFHHISLWRQTLVVQPTCSPTKECRVNDNQAART